MSLKNYYEILGLSQSASFKEVRSRYRDLVKQYHPDKKGKAFTEQDEATLGFIMLAYQKISDAQKEVKKLIKERDEFINPRDKMPEYNKSKTTIHVHTTPAGKRATYFNGKIVR